MVERGRGKIVFTASLLSFQGGINVASYTAAKSGLVGLVRALSNEWAPHGVNVNAIAPGYIATDNTQALRDDPDRYRAILERIPAGRWGEPGDLAGATVFLASAASDYVDGIVLPGRRRLARAMTDALSRACRPRVLPVATVSDVALAAPLAAALAAGGATAIEVTFRTEAAPRVIAALADSELVVGAGTIRTAAQVDEALAAGAQFVVSPALDDAVVERCLDAGVPVLPGIATATELARALALGVRDRQALPGRASRRRRADLGARRAVSRGSLRPDRGVGDTQRGRLPPAAAGPCDRRQLDGRVEAPRGAGLGHGDAADGRGDRASARSHERRATTSSRSAR